MHRIILLAAVWSLGACTCSPAPRPQRVEIPRDALPILTSGLLAFPLVNTAVFTPIRPGVGSILFSQEFEKAPGMTSLSLNPQSVAAIENLIPTNLSVPPLERDLALCKAQELPDGGTAPFPTQPFHESPPILFFNPDAGLLPFTTSSNSPLGVVRLDHVRGNVTSVSLMPDSPATGVTEMLVDGRTGVTSFAFATTVENLDLKLSVGGLPVTVNVSSIAISCPGVISRATTNVPLQYLSCGEQNVRCVSPTITITDLTTNVEFPLVQEVIEGVVHDKLEELLSAGVNLHFQNFAPTSFTFLPTSSGGQALTVIGSSTVVNGGSPCSPVAPAEPAAGPTRALGRLHATWGSVMQTSTRGRVNFIDLVPEADMVLESNHPQAFALINRKTLHRGPNVGFVEALPLDQPFAASMGTTATFQPSGIVTRLRVVKRGPGTCWLQSLNLTDLEFLRNGRVLSRWAAGEDASLSEELKRMSEGPMGLRSLQDVDFQKELAPLLKEAGMEGDFGNARWSRVTIGVPRPVDGPFPWPSPPTGELHVYTDLPFAELQERFEPQLVCNGEFQEPVASEQRVSDPEVDFGAFKVDSVDITADTLPTTDRRTSFTRRSNRDHVVITLPASCPADPPGRPTVASCWTETLRRLPKTGSIAVRAGFSDTTQRTGSLRSETPEALGDRSAAMHGVFDRSGVAVYTKVPDDYRSFTSQTFDYRGVITLDWNHDPSFVRSAPSRHFNAPGYAPAPRRFFTNWLSDRFELRHAGQWPPSNCLLPEMRLAVPTELQVNEYDSTGTNTLRVWNTLPAQLAISGASSFGDYRVSPGVSRSFATVFFYP